MYIDIYIRQGIMRLIMKKLFLILPMVFAFCITSCNGGGDSNGGGGVTPNPTPAPLPAPGKVTYALLAITGANKIYSAPLDTNGNLLWSQGVYTAKEISWDNPYYIVVNPENTYAYISDAPLSNSSTTNGAVYRCSLSQTGTLSNCSKIISNIGRPVSMALQGNYLYVSNAVANGVIQSCNLTTNTCTAQSTTAVTGLQPTGVAVSSNTAYVTYGVPNDATTTSSKYALYSFNLNPTTGAMSGGKKASTTSSLSNPTDLTVNNNFVYISNYAYNSVSQYNATLTDTGSPVSTIFKGNFEISMNSTNTYAYIINGAINGDIKGYISKCTVQSTGLLNNSCTPLSDSTILQQPYGIAITGELQGPQQ